MCEKVTHLHQLLLTFLFLLMTSLFSQVSVLKLKIVFLYEPYPTNAKSLATSSGSLPVVFACFFLCLTKVFSSEWQQCPSNHSSWLWPPSCLSLMPTAFCFLKHFSVRLSHREPRFFCRVKHQLHSRCSQCP